MNPFGWYHQLIRSPRYRGWVILGSLLYMLSPLDLSPDLIPLVGQLDDVVIMTLLFSEVFRVVINRFMPELQAQESDRPSSQDQRTSYQDSDQEMKTVEVKAVSID
jgi:uncharacterized membrane protein YkvA (DUF1232 family)